MKLYYVCEWEKNKEKTWSGTTYSLFNALKSKLNEIEDIDVRLNKFDKLAIMISNLNNIKIRDGKIIVDYKFANMRLRIYRHKLKKGINRDNIPILQVGDHEIYGKNNYVYQDLSIDSLLYFKENKEEVFEYSTFQNYSMKELYSRREEQMKFYNQSKGIFTMSKWLADNLIKYSNLPKEKVHWVGAGINLNTNNIENVDKTGNKILFVGRDFIRKGGDITYSAFKILKQKYLPDAELYIAGPSEYPINEISEGVTFLGDISSQELSYYFNICDIFCMPSRFEAYGLVFIEALVYGLPCIGRNEFEMKEFIKNDYNGYLIENDDINVLAEKMYNLLKSDRIKENVISNRETYIKQYSWNTVADRMINIIKLNDE